MVLRDPYQFELLHLHDNTVTVNSINNYIVTEYGYIKDSQLFRPKSFSSALGDIKPVVLYGGTAIEQDIPNFSHPLFSPKNRWVALDLRQVVRKDAATGQLHIRNTSDYSLQTLKFILTCNWYAGKESSLYGFRFPHITYAEWLSTNITRKFGLNMAEQVQLFTLAAIYYATLFTENFGEEDLQKLELRLKDQIFASGMIEEVHTRAGTLSSIEDFCNACYTVTDSPRLKGFDKSVLLNTLSNNWFSAGGNELAILSLCHPPTWISLVYASLTSKTYRNSYISKVVEDKNKRGIGQEFIKELEAVVKSQVEH